MEHVEELVHMGGSGHERRGLEPVCTNMQNMQKYAKNAHTAIDAHGNTFTYSTLWYTQHTTTPNQSKRVVG